MSLVSSDNQTRSTSTAVTTATKSLTSPSASTSTTTGPTTLLTSTSNHNTEKNHPTFSLHKNSLQEKEKASSPSSSAANADHKSSLLQFDFLPGGAFIGKFMDIQSINPVLKSFLVGSISGTCSTLLFQPFDLVKTRLQAPIANGQASLGMMTAFGNIVRHENLLSLWKGITPATIHGLKIQFNIHGEPTALQSVLLGVTGRSISGVMMIPFTVIKTRFESRAYEYKSIRQALSQIYKVEGLRGLTCGLLPTLMRDAPFSGIYLLAYTTTKKTVPQQRQLPTLPTPRAATVPQDLLESTTLGPYVRFSCGIVAGIGASFATQPFDVIKTKMQLYPNKFNSTQQVIAYVYKKYGASGYFKGLVPRMLRRTLIAAMSWTVYEQLMRNVGLK